MLQLPVAGQGNLAGMARFPHPLAGIAATALIGVGPAGAAAAEVAAPAAQRVHQFQVLLDGKPIGTHRFAITMAADGTASVVSSARFDVKLLGLTVYRYRHEAREQWRGDCLHQMEAETSDNGSPLQVRAVRQPDASFQVTAPRPLLREGCVISYAYWDRDRLLSQRELFNPQTGEFDAVTFERVGSESLPLPGGARAATRYRLRGDKLELDLWYAESGEWLQLASKARGNRELLYRATP